MDCHRDFQRAGQGFATHNAKAGGFSNESRPSCSEHAGSL